MTNRIGPRRTPNPYIPRDGAWFHGQHGADERLYTYARGDWRAFVHVNRRGAVSWAVCRVMGAAEWSQATCEESAQALAWGALNQRTVFLAKGTVVK